MDIIKTKLRFHAFRQFYLLLASVYLPLAAHSVEQEKRNKKKNEKEQSQFIRTYRVHSILMTTVLFFIIISVWFQWNKIFI